MAVEVPHPNPCYPEGYEVGQRAHDDVAPLYVDPQSGIRGMVHLSGGHLGLLVVVSPVYGKIQVEDRNINVSGVNYWFSSSKKEKCFPDEFRRFFIVFRF